MDVLLKLGRQRRKRFRATRTTQVCFRLPKALLKILDTYVDSGRYRNRDQIMLVAAKNLIKKENRVR
jgi:Arc/MetJ-type ribon-helix-helix transcriptional regulator